MKMVINPVKTELGSVEFYDIRNLGYLDNEGVYQVVREYPPSVIVGPDGILYRYTLQDQFKNFDDHLLTDLATGISSDWMWVDFDDDLDKRIIIGAIETVQASYHIPYASGEAMDMLSEILIGRLHRFYGINLPKKDEKK